MKVRAPNWDYSKVHAHWAPNHEFAQSFNASSTIPAYIEPYLVKVMIQAKQKLDPDNEELHENLNIFIKQEIQHCKQHIAYNDALHADGYEDMLELEKLFEADYDRFLKEKSLRFNCAYSEGFEAMSSIAVAAFFEEFDEFFEGADPLVVNLWKWHLAEEYEHREVAHDVYHALFGQNRIFAYFYRIYGFFYATLHIAGHAKRVSAYLLSKDRENMSPEELKQSKMREQRSRRKMLKPAIPYLLAILSPFYNPAKRPPPRGALDFLDNLNLGLK